MLDKNSTEPLYLQLYKKLKSDIENKIFLEGEKLPSENTLKETYNVSRATVRQTLSQLEKDCLIYKENRKGSFVSFNSLHQNLDEFYSFSEELKNIGKTPKFKLLKLEKIIPNDTLRKIMNLNAKEKVYKIEIIRKVDKEPILFETTYLPMNRFYNFEKVNLNTTPLYDILQKHYNVKFTEAVQTFYPTLPNAIIKEYLCISPNETIPCMKVERTSYEETTIIEFTEAIVKGDKLKYTVHLKPNYNQNTSSNE